LDSDNRKYAFILDDTSYYRNRSKKVELLSKCYDHAEHRYYKGFTLLNLGWSDGVTFMPVDFRLIASGNDKNLLVSSSIQEDNRTLATRRRQDARSTKPEIALKMLKSAKDTPAQAKYVVFDSWFSSPHFILSVAGLGYAPVARLKNNENFRFLYDDKPLSISQIYQSCKKRRGLSRYLLSVTVKVRHDDFKDPVEAKIVYVREKKNRKNWIAILCTDTSLSEDEIVELYGKRWDIEPFHKMIKSFLRLAKEFQMRSFDAMVAHTSIVLVRYMFLSLEVRENKDERTFGEIFHAVCDELQDISFQYAFNLIMSVLASCLQDYLLLSKNCVDSFIKSFLEALPVFLQVRLGVLLCES
jgi:hypothetical protein